MNRKFLGGIALIISALVLFVTTSDNSLANPENSGNQSIVSTSFEMAFDDNSLRLAVSSGANTIYIMNDFDLYSSVIIPANDSITLIPTDHNVTITTNGNFRHFTVNGTLLMTQSDLGTVITLTNHDSEVNGGGIQVNGTGELILDAGVITGNRAVNGGGVIVENNGRMTMDGGRIISNTATTNGGGIRLGHNTTLEMNNGTISANQANSGGGISFGEFAVLILNEGEITANDALNGNGGGVAFSGAGTVTMRGGTIAYNTSTGSGAGINGTIGLRVTMYDGIITNNETTNSNGGGINFGNDGIFNPPTARSEIFIMHNGSIVENTAARLGGGVNFHSSGNLTINSGEISRNNAQDGGAISFAHFWGTSTFNILDGEFDNNTATRHGGALHFNFWGTAPTVNIQGGSFTENSAVSGGAIHTPNFNRLVIGQDVVFWENTASTAFWIEDYQDETIFNEMTIPEIKAWFANLNSISASPNNNLRPFNYLVNNFDINFHAGEDDLKPLRITFHSNDGTGRMITLHVQPGEIITNIPEFERNGYDFTGWTGDVTGEEFPNGIMVNTDMDLFAEWSNGDTEEVEEENNSSNPDTEETDDEKPIVNTSDLGQMTVYFLVFLGSAFGVCFTLKNKLRLRKFSI